MPRSRVSTKQDSLMCKTILLDRHKHAYLEGLVDIWLSNAWLAYLAAAVAAALLFW